MNSRSLEPLGVTEFSVELPESHEKRAGREGSQNSYCDHDISPDRRLFANGSTAETEGRKALQDSQGFRQKETADFLGELGKGSITQSAKGSLKNIQVAALETETEEMASGHAGGRRSTEQDLSPVQFIQESYSEVYGEGSNLFPQELEPVGGTRNGGAELRAGPTYMVTPANNRSGQRTAAEITRMNLEVGSYERKYFPAVNEVVLDYKHDDAPLMEGTNAAEPPVPTVGPPLEVEEGSQSGSSSSLDSLEDDESIRAQLKELQEAVRLMSTKAKAEEEAKAAQEKEAKERLKELEETKKELQKLREEKKEKKKQKEYDDQLKSINLQAPRTTEVKQWTANMKNMGAYLENRSDYHRWSTEIIARQRAEKWPEELVDLGEEKWDYAKETPLQTRARREMYSLMFQTVNTKKHYHKVRAKPDAAGSERQEDAQALWRTMHKYFAIGRQNGDLDTLKETILKTSMINNEMAVTEYGLECQRLERIKAEMGVPSNEQLELIPQYLKGLTKNFQEIRGHIKTQMQEGKKYTLEEVIAKVEERAVADGCLEKVPKKNGQVYNGVATQQKRGKGNRQPRKTWRQQAKQLKQEVVNLEHQAKQAATQLNANAKATAGSKKDCKFGKKCWGRGCQNKHPAGWKPNDPTKATCSKCQRTGHTTAEHGQCFKCKKMGHMARDCPDAVQVQQNVQTTTCAPAAEEMEMYVVGEEPGQGDANL